MSWLVRIRIPINIEKDPDAINKARTALGFMYEAYGQPKVQRATGSGWTVAWYDVERSPDGKDFDDIDIQSQIIKQLPQAVIRVAIFKRPERRKSKRELEEEVERNNNDFFLALDRHRIQANDVSMSREERARKLLAAGMSRIFDELIEEKNNEGNN